MASNGQQGNIGDDAPPGSSIPINLDAEGDNHNTEARDQGHRENDDIQKGEGKYYNEDNLQVWSDRCLRRDEEVKELANKLADLQSVVNFMMQNN